MARNHFVEGTKSFIADVQQQIHHPPETTTQKTPTKIMLRRSFFSFNLVRSSASSSLIVSASSLPSSAAAVTLAALSSSSKRSFAHRTCALLNSSSASAPSPSIPSSSAGQKEIPIGSPEDKTLRAPAATAAAARAMKSHEAFWSAKPEKVPTPGKPKSGLKQTSIQESLELEMQQQQQQQQQTSGRAATAADEILRPAEIKIAPEEQPQEQWCSVPTLYRRIIKLIVRKFGSHPDVAVRSWKQAKYEFWYFRNAPKEDVPMLVHRGKMIHSAVMGGIVPVVHNPTTGLSYCKYDKETLAAAGGVIDPISAEEFLRRNADKIDKAELHDMRDKLKEAGRWNGADEFKKDDIPKLKTKRKVKCTDPDPVEEDSAPSAAAASSSSSSASTAEAAEKK